MKKILLILCVLFTFTLFSCGDDDDIYIPDQPTDDVDEYDLSGVIFNDMRVKYDGQGHSLYAYNVPKNIRCEYSGESFIDIGEYKVTVYFYSKKDDSLIGKKTATLTIYSSTNVGELPWI